MVVTNFLFKTFIARLRKLLKIDIITFLYADTNIVIILQVNIKKLNETNLEKDDSEYFIAFVNNFIIIIDFNVSSFSRGIHMNERING